MFRFETWSGAEGCEMVQFKLYIPIIISHIVAAIKACTIYKKTLTGWSNYGDKKRVLHNNKHIKQPSTGIHQTVINTYLYFSLYVAKIEIKVHVYGLKFPWISNNLCNENRKRGLEHL